MDKKVAVLTNLMDLPRQYGVVPVVLNQLSMLDKFGANPVLFAVRGFNKHPDRKMIPSNIEVRDSVPFAHIFDYQPGTPEQTYDVDGVGLHGGPSGNKTNYKKQVDYYTELLDPQLAEFDVVITHDIMFQSWFLTMNAAVRRIGKNHPNIKWLHWCHSGPSPRQATSGIHLDRYSGMPNSVFVIPNESMGPKFAEMYNVPLSEIKAVYHTFDPKEFFDMHPLSREMIDKHDLASCDYLTVWPTRIDHVETKGIREAILWAAQMNKYSNTKLLFLNSWSGGKEYPAKIKGLHDYAESKGMPKGNLIFSSEMGLEWVNGVPKQVVRDMLMIGDIYISPSQTETFSLAMIEAAACKNLLVLNEDLTVYKELAGDRAEYILNGSCWGGTQVTRNFDPSKDQYYLERAKDITETLKKNKAIQQHRHVLKYYNQEWVWNNQLKPLIFN